jgi:hypothetical protein
MLLGRSIHRRVAWLALCALWLQLGLSFGHAHPEDFFGLGGPHQAQLSADHAVPGLPLGPISDPLGHEACSICASVSLAGVLIVPVPPAIVPPRFDRGAPLPLYDHVVTFRAPHLLFQTRAPPVA